MPRIIVWLLLVLTASGTILLVGCSENSTQNSSAKHPAQETPNASVQDDDPRSVLTYYFEVLSKEDFKSLAEYYGGSYDDLKDYAPNVDPNDKAGLLRNYIKVTGGQIVRLNKIIQEEALGSESFRYRVNFLSPDGSIFRNGQIYEYTVKKVNGKYKVMDLPPYVA